MCVNGKLVSALEVMNARWDYRGHRWMSVLKMVDGVMSMGMMSVVEVVISCHIFLLITVLFLLCGFCRFL